MNTTKIIQGLKGIALLASAAVFLLIAHPSFALTPQVDERITLKGEEPTKGPLVLAGKEIHIENIVEGDVFVLAQRAVIAGEIRGDLTVVAPEIRLTGKITGDVAALGFISEVTGTIEGTTVAASAQCAFTGSVADIFTACLGADLSGNMSGDAWVYANQLHVGVTGPGGIHARVPVVLVRPETRLSGSLRQVGQVEAVVSEGAQIGSLDFTKLPFKVYGRYEGWQGYAALFLSQLIWIVVVGVGIYFLQKKWLQRASDAMTQRVFMNLWVGIGVVLFTTFISLLLFVSRLGWQFGAVLTLTLLLLAHVGIVVFANAMGRSIGRWIWKGRPAEMRHLLFGSVVVAILLVLPIVGSLIWIIIVLVGLGTLTKMAWQGRLKKPATT